MTSLKLITAPAKPVLLLDEVKEFIRLTNDAENSLISRLIETARQHLEGRYGVQNRALITQEWEVALSSFPDCPDIEIPLAPLQSVSSVKYYDVKDIESTLEPARYSVDIRAEPGQVILNYGEVWPTVILRPSNGVIIKFKAGFGDDAQSVPETLKIGMLWMIDEWYNHRSPEGMASDAVNRILAPTRIYSFA